MNWIERAVFVILGVVVKILLRTVLIISAIPMILAIPASVPLPMTQMVPILGVARVLRTVYSIRLRRQSSPTLPLWKRFMSFSTKAPIAFLSLLPTVLLALFCLLD